MIIIGYSGHAFVACGILQAAGMPPTAYCDFEEKEHNPFQLQYLGSENDAKGLEAIRDGNFFIGVGDNSIREKVYRKLEQRSHFPVNAIHPSLIIDPSAKLNGKGIMISSGVIINPLALIAAGAIINTRAVVEHECVVGEFAHIGPGAVLCGNVTVGAGSFVGAAAVVRQGVRIGRNVMIGAGAVVLSDVADGKMVAGNPAKDIIKKTN